MNPITLLGGHSRHPKVAFFSISFVFLLLFGSIFSNRSTPDSNTLSPHSVISDASSLVINFDQQGGDVSGEEELESAGWATDISHDGSVLIVGSRNAYPVPPLLKRHNVPGRARVYKWNGIDWGSPIVDISGDDENREDRYGEAVAVSGNARYAAISAPGFSNRKGKVLIYDLESTDQSTTYTIEGLSEQSEFGNAIAFSYYGEYLAVAARRDGFDAGYVKIYKKNGDDNSFEFSQYGNTILGDGPSRMSGWSLDLSGNGTRVVIGAHTGRRQAPHLGTTKVYEFDSCEETWEQVGSDISEEEIGGGAPYALTTNSNGTIVAIGERSYDEGKGRVRIFKYSESNNDWSPGPILQSDGVDTKGEFGFSVSFSDDAKYLAVGERVYDNAIGASTGRTTIFKQNGSNWESTGVITGETHGVHSGRVVSVSGNGKLVAIGEPRHIWGGGMHFLGRVRVFKIPQ